MTDKLNILVTGAFGNIGQEVVRQLVEHKSQYNITAFGLPSKQAKKIARKFDKHVIIVWGDITDKSVVEHLCEKIDVVIHLAAIIPPHVFNSLSQTIKVNVEGTKNLIKGLEKHSPKAFFLFSSSVATYGDRNEDPWIAVDDELKVSEGDDYAVTKIEAENAIQNSNLNWSIIRLAAVMGYGNHKVSKIMFLMPLDTPFEIITLKNAATVFVKAIEKREVMNKNIYNAGGGENCRTTYLEFLSRNFKTFGLGKANFKKNSFATHNWHAAYYKDGDILEDILHFRSDTLEDYFNNLKKTVPAYQKILTQPFSPVIKYFLGRLSEPREAIKQGNQKLINRFFKNGRYE